MPVPDSLLPNLRYHALCVPGGMPVEVKSQGVHAASFPPEMSHLDAWVRVDFTGTRPQRRDDPVPPDHGWKAHISVHASHVAQAWDAILPIVAREPMRAKVVNEARAEAFGDPGNAQAGKTIVLYADGCPYAQHPKFWSRLLSGVETALRAAAIPPGWAVLGDMPLANSAYAFVRADKDLSGRYATGIEAYNPFGHPCPYDGSEIRAEGRPVTPVEPREDRIERMLNFISPGWEPVEGGFTLWCADQVDAAMTSKALRLAGFNPAAEGEIVTLTDLSEGKVMRHWHRALEIRRAAEVGGIMREAIGDGAKLSLSLQRDNFLPPAIKLTLGTAECADGIKEALGPVFTGPGVHVDRDTLTIPYGGRLHVAADARPKWFARLAEVTAEAAERHGCKPAAP